MQTHQDFLELSGLPVQIEKMKNHIAWLEALSKVRETDCPLNLQFKPSRSKKDRSLAAIPLNLQAYTQVLFSSTFFFSIRVK
jgi:hypothetical protein